MTNKKSTTNKELDNSNNEVARLALTFALLNNEQYEAARIEVLKLREHSPQRIDYVIAQKVVQYSSQLTYPPLF